MAVVAIFFSLPSCYYDNEEELYPQTANCDTTNTTYSGFVSKLMNQRCAIPGCHIGPGSASIGTFDNHGGLKATLDTKKANFIGSIKHSPGANPMPKGSAKLSDCDIQKLEIWINAGYPNN